MGSAKLRKFHAMFHFKLLPLCILLCLKPTSGQLSDLRCEFSGGFFSSANLCKWSPDSKDKYVFITGKAREPTALADGPLGSANLRGTFIQLQEKQAELVSKDIKVAKFCLTFSYYLFGSAMGAISILRTDRKTGTGEIIYYRNQDHENIDKWHHFQATIPGHIMSSRFYTIAAKREDGTKIAIDSIIPSSGACKTSRYYCDFDLSTSTDFNCPWVTFTASSENFTWSTSVAIQKEFDIDKDHSSRSGFGRYLVPKDFSSAPVGTTWSIVFPAIDSKSPNHCLSFWVYQNSYVDLSLYHQDIGLETEPINTTIWHSVESGKPFWARKMFDITKDDYSPLLRIKLNMKKLEKSDQPVGIDSILYSDGVCPKPANCDFDENFCGFDGSGSKWLIGKGRVANPENIDINFTPPVSTSRYTYVDFSMSSEKLTAVLSSDDVPPGDYCLKWNDYQSKFENHSFAIHAADFKGTKLFSIYESETPVDIGTWTSRSKTVSAIHLQKDFRLLFTVESVQGFTALDDVELNRGKCLDDQNVQEPLIEIYGSCDFENGLCEWENLYDRLTGGHWQVNGRDGIFLQNMPRADATLRSYLGHYIYFATSETEEEAILRLKLAITPETPSGKYCFALQSIIKGDDAANLTINFKGTGIDRSVVVTPSVEWQFTQTDFVLSDSSNPLDISLNAYVSGDSAISVDDIKVYNGACHHLADRSEKQVYACAFRDEDKCEINIDNISEDQIPPWSMQRIQTHQMQEGNALVTDISRPTASGRTRFVLPRLRPRVKTCLTFWYLMKATENVTLRLLLEKGYEREDDDQPSEVILQVSENNGDNWNPARIEIVDEAQWRLVFEVEVSDANTFENRIAVTDISIQKGACPSYYSCSFEDDSCLWHNMKTVVAIFRIEAYNLWNRHQSQMVTGSSNYPKTTSEGHQGSYFLTGRINSSALLVSPRFDWPADEEVKHACFTFWDYYVDAFGGGTIFLANSLTGDVEVILNMHKKNSPDHQWVKKKVQIQRSDYKSFWLIFHAYKDRDQSFNALDDMRLEFGECPAEKLPFICDNGLKSIASDRVCNFIYDCEDKTDEAQCGYNCDLSKDKNRCGWKATPGSAWKLAATNVGTRMQASNLAPLSKAFYTSPLMRKSTSTCVIEFKASYSPRRAKIITEISVEGQDNVEVWSSDYFQASDEPDKAVAKFMPGKITSDFKIILSVVAPSHLSSLGKDTSLSSLQFDDNCFVEKYDKTPCRDGYFKCDNGRCIPNLDICNLRDDCGDNSDESEEICKDRTLLTCNFNSFCFFDHEPKDGPRNPTGFILRSGFDKVSDGPTRDNTENSKSGSFVFLSNAGGALGYRTATLFTNEIWSDCITFYLYSRGEVRLRVNDHFMMIPQEPMWHKHTVDGLSFHDSLNITATTSDYNCYLAIDDFSWGTSCSNDHRRPSIRPTKAPTDVSTPSPAVAPDNPAIFKELTCDFNDGQRFCDWSGTVGTWKVMGLTEFRTSRDGPLSSSPFYNTKPDTTQAIVTGTAESPKAILRTPELYMGKYQDICFTFDYYLFGNLGSLSLQQVDKSGSKRYLFYRDQEHGNVDMWRQYSLNIPYMEDTFSVLFEASTDTLDTYVALDNLLALPGKCETKKTYCDFDHAIDGKVDCDWLNLEDSNSVKFTAVLPETLAAGPSADHSTRSKYGHYLTAVAQQALTSPEKVRLYLAAADSDYGEHCLSFYYYRPGPDDDEISVVYSKVGAVEENTEEILMTAKYRGGEWTKATVSLPYKNEDMYTFTIMITKSDKKPESVVGLDSILLTPGACFEPLSCDFDSNFCDYSPASDNSDNPMATRWLIGQGRLYDRTQAVGPAGQDYSAFSSQDSSSSYAYVDLTSPNLNRQTKYNLRLESQPWSVKKTMESSCLRFKYYLNGILPADSSFSVNLHGVDAVWRDEVWTLTKPESFRWIPIQVNIDRVREGMDVKIRFELDTKPSSFVLALADVDITVRVDCDSHIREGLIGPQTLSCDFDDGSFCSWKMDKKQLALWKISNNDAMLKNKHLPKYDHASMGQNGSYAYLAETLTRKSENSLTLLLTDDTMKPGAHCMSLWSVTNSKNIQRATSVSIEPDTFSFIPRSSSWSFFEIDFVKEAEKNINVAIRATTGLSQTNAIDDIEFHQGTCDSLTIDRETMYFCTFEGINNCGIAVYEEVTSGVTWKRTRDFSDHTNYGIGYSMMLEMKSTEEGSSTFYTKYVHPREGACLIMWYKMETKVDPTIELTVKLVKSTAPDDYMEAEELIYEDVGYRGLEQWHPIIYQIDYKGKWRLAIQATYKQAQDRGNDRIAIDDILIKRGACPSSAYSCDFNDDNCPWQSVTKFSGSVDGKHSEHQLDLQWQRFPSTQAEYAQPRLDSQAKEGNYLILSGDPGEGVLRSPRLTWPTGKQVNQGCFSFWAFTDNEAEVDVYYGTTFDDWIPKIKGTKLTKTLNWQKLYFDIEQKDDAPYFWLYILGYIEKYSFVAIDDISVQFDESCPASMAPFKCDDGTYIDYNMECDFKEDCHDGSDEKGCSYKCDFSDGTLCGYRPKQTLSSFKWTAMAAPSEIDKMRQPPKNIVAYAKTSQKGQRSELHSVHYRNTGVFCKFEIWNWLHTWGSFYAVDFSIDLTIDGQQRVQVYDGSVRTTLGQLPPKDWQRGVVYLGEIASEFQLIILLDVKQNRFTSAAIDAFKFIDCLRHDFPEDQECNNEFSCYNNKCVPWHRICDGQNDCEDNGDEYGHSNCDEKMKCNFDDNGYCNGIADGFTLTSGRTKLLDGPTRDHSTNSHHGSFVITKSLKATLTIPNRAAVLTRCATFYVQAWAKTATLTVDKKPVDIVVDQPGLWQQVNVASEGSIHIEVSQDGAGWVAIDDVFYKQHCYGDNSTVPTTSPSVTASEPKFAEKNFACYESSGKIPKYTICDDTMDCPKGEDETRQLCGEIKCAYGGIFCQLKSNSKFDCLKDTKLYCDGKADCFDGSDEDPRLCNIGLSCKGWCLRDGVCKPKNGCLDSCSCKEPFYGKRCQYPDDVSLTTPQTDAQTTPFTTTNLPAKPTPAKPTPAKPTPPKPTASPASTTKSTGEISKPEIIAKKTSAGSGAIIFFTVIIILLSSAIAYFVYRKRFWSSRSGDDTQPMVDSDYGVQMNEVRLNQEFEDQGNDSNNAED